MADTIIVRVLGKDDLAVLDTVAEDVFDGPVDPRWAGEFLADPRHHLAVAIADGVVVGMASGVHYVHPDKAPELWVNEVGVSPPFQNQGLGRRLVRLLFARGREVGCATGWVGTDFDNLIARKLYRSVGGVEESQPFVLVNFSLEEGEIPEAHTLPDTQGVEKTKTTGPEKKSETSQVVQRFWDLMATNQFAQVVETLAEDFVLEWPQSGERIRGGARFAQMNAEYPTQGRWSFTVERVLVQGDEAVTHCTVTDGIQTGTAISFFTVKAGKIQRLVEFWPEPFAPAKNRSHLVETRDG